MSLTNEGLDEVEEFADKQHNGTILLLIQILREIRELKILQEHQADDKGTKIPLAKQEQAFIKAAEYIKENKINSDVKATVGEKTRERVNRAIELISLDIESCREDYALIADIILQLAKTEYMSATRALEVLSDVEKIIPLISELRLL